MPSVASDPASPTTRQFPWRGLTLVICVSGGLIAAILSKKGGFAAPAAKPVPVELTADQTLAKIPEPAGGTSETNRVLGLLRQKVTANPNDAVAWVNLGDGLAQALRETADERFYDAAELAYGYALRVKPESVDALSGMAWVTGGRHLFDQSKDWANRALALDASNAAALGIMGDADVELGDYEAAFDHYQKMMDAKPDLSSWSRGAHLLWLTGDSKKAVWLMEKAIKAGAPFAENSAWCRANLAMMLFHQGALPSAAQVLEPPLRAGSRNTHVLLAAGRIAAARDDLAAAEKYYKLVLEGAPNHEALAALGDLSASRGEQREAESYYSQVEALDAQQFARAGHSHLAMAKFYADHDRKLIEALRLAEERKLTKNINEADTLAWVYFKNGDQPQAIAAIKRALSQKTQNAEIHFHAGMIAAKAGDRVSAQNHLQQALDLNPRFGVLQAPIAVSTLAELGSVKATARAAPGATSANP